ncbi:MAG: outer membrane lipoprotein-sorting protein [Pseudomonadota bacterium]
MRIFIAIGAALLGAMALDPAVGQGRLNDSNGPSPAISAEAIVNLRADEIVRHIDNSRFPSHYFKLVNTVDEFKDGRRVASAIFSTFAGRHAVGGEVSSAAVYQFPKQDSGKSILYRDNQIWFYDNIARSTVRLSPAQRLLGQASAADVLMVDFGRQYSPHLLGRERITDYEGREIDCVVLELTEPISNAQYSEVRIWFDISTQRMARADYYSDTGRSLKSAYYADHKEIFGSYRPTKTVIIDSVNPRNVTVITSSDFGSAAIREDWFRRSNLRNISLSK